VNDPNRFPDSAFDRIAAYLPAEQRASYYRYVAHLRTLNPKDELLILAEGMAVFTCISRLVPEALADEREKLLTEFSKLCTKHESFTANATTDVRAMFAAQQKLLEQNVATWQNREQHAAQSLDRIAKRFEEAVNQAVARLQAAGAKVEAATKEHETAASRARNWVSQVTLGHQAWPWVACTLLGSLATIVVQFYLQRKEP
jgi:hypothetical protein